MLGCTYTFRQAISWSPGLARRSGGRGEVKLTLRNAGYVLDRSSELFFDFRGKVSSSSRNGPDSAKVCLVEYARVDNLVNHGGD